MPTKSTKPDDLVTFNLRIEALAIAGEAHGLCGESLVDYVVSHCLDQLRANAEKCVENMRLAGRIH